MVSGCKRRRRPLGTLIPRREVVARQFHLLAYEQPVHLIVEQREVERLDVLKVVVARLVERREFAVHEIVVERDRHRFLARKP